MKNLGKKKLLIIMGGIVGIVILIIIILLVYNAIFGKTSYADIENQVLNAAKEYYSYNSSLIKIETNSTLDKLSLITRAKENLPQAR